jgi:two-component system, cell cycle response regulator
MQSEHRSPVPGTPGAESLTVPMTGAAVLVVDDNPVNRMMLARFVERLGCTVVPVDDGSRALETARAGAFDLILLDILMPGMDGFAVLSALKADPVLRAAPVIVISALDDVADVARCLELGADDYMPKPFNPVLLRARLAAALERKRLRAQQQADMRDAARLTDATLALATGAYDPESLVEVARRPDPLGQLARSIQRLARAVVLRESGPEDRR